MWFFLACYVLQYHLKLSGGWLLVSMELRYNFRSTGGFQTRDIEWYHPNPSVDKGTEPDVEK